MLSLPLVATSPPVTNDNGVILWEGPSWWDGEPLVAIATALTTASKNEGTGDMVQTWILKADQHPAEAVKNKTDKSCCGDCGLAGSICYVATNQAPSAIWGAYKRNRYPKHKQRQHRELFLEKPIRFGSYGDPAMVPYKVWLPFFRLTAKPHGKPWRTGYTHQWKKCDQRFSQWLMASCDSPEDFYKAQSMGWKPFRNRLPDEPLLPGEFLCPKSKEAGARLTCEQCLACAGGRWTGQATPVIVVHGGINKPESYRKWREHERSRRDLGTSPHQGLDRRPGGGHPAGVCGGEKSHPPAAPVRA